MDFKALPFLIMSPLIIAALAKGAVIGATIPPATPRATKPKEKLMIKNFGQFCFSESTN